MNPGVLFIVSAPSGAGKTSLVKALCERVDNLMLSVSHTTRAQRPGEVDGVDYHFIDKTAFERSVAAGGYLEHAQVFDNYYGTSRKTTENLMQRGKDVILEIDWQGARQVIDRMPVNLSVFILPPSLLALEQRLRGRGQDSDEVIARRMLDAKEQMEHYSEYDYLIINDNFDVALDELAAVFCASHLRASVQSDCQQVLLRDLLA
ncbi:MAG: guanylate kinase [Thiothrix sp.]|nr:MAG: guanylate kinase [Thiothrix sp.]